MAISLPIVSKFDDKGTKDAELKLGALQGIALGAFAKIGAAAVTAFADAARAVVDFGKDSVIAAAHAESVFRGLENAAKQSDAFRNVSGDIAAATKALDYHSKALGELIGVDDEVLSSLKRTWLAVPSLAQLGADGINNLAKVASDVAAGTGKDIGSIGQAFIKIAGDQETALSKLTRMGVVFTKDQKAQYQSLLDSNRELDAQAYLIGELGKTYQGAAEAMANPFERMKVIVGNFQEDVGAAFLPIIEEWVPRIAAALKYLTEVVFPAIATWWNAHVVSPLQKFWTEQGPLLIEAWGKIKEALQPFIDDVFPSLALAMQMLWDYALKYLLEQLANLAKWFTDPRNAEYVKAFGLVMGVLGAAIFAATMTIPLMLAAIAALVGGLIAFAIEVQKIAVRVKNYFVDLAGGIVDSVNAIIRAINRLSLIDLPELPRIYNTPIIGNPEMPLAAGGIVTGPTRALVGEAGPEAVIPLDRFDDVVGKRGGNINITVNAGMGADGAALGEQIVNAIRRYERTSGAVFARA